MCNPWIELPLSEPFVLLCDAEAIEEFNEQEDPEHAILPEFIPSPFLGNPDAPVVLLYMTPHSRNPKEDLLRNVPFRDAAVNNLKHCHQEYPIYQLAPDYPGQWWRKRMHSLTEQAGCKSVASNVFIIQIHGYYPKKAKSTSSASARKLAEELPSFAYTRHLVLKAIERQAIIGMMCGKPAWDFLVPELQGHVSHPIQYQKPYVSPKNCRNDGLFDKILAAVKNSA